MQTEQIQSELRRLKRSRASDLAGGIFAIVGLLIVTPFFMFASPFLFIGVGFLAWLCFVSAGGKPKQIEYYEELERIWHQQENPWENNQA